MKFSSKPCDKQPTPRSVDRVVLGRQGTKRDVDSIRMPCVISYWLIGLQVMVLTGGPGTGKTTTARGIIQLFEQLGAEVSNSTWLVMSCSHSAIPTGRVMYPLHQAGGIGGSYGASC